MNSGTELYPQCFSSPGNPVGGSMNMGIMKKNAFRIIAAANYQYYSGYYEGSEPSPFKLYHDASSWYCATILSYGLTSNITIETENGYFISRRATYDPSLTGLPEYSVFTNGFANGTFSIKTIFIRNDEKRLRWTGGIGLKYPYSSLLSSRNGVTLPYDIQSSTHAFGYMAQTMIVKEFPFTAWRIMFSSRYEKNFTHSSGYRYGDIWLNSILASKHLQLPFKCIDDKFTAILQIKNEYRTYSYYNNKKIAASGSTIIYITPQLNYTVTKKINISFLFDLPVYRYYNGIQLSIRESCTLVIIKDI